MITDFSELGLDYDTVRENLYELGILDSVDDTTFSASELENLMFVANLALQFSIAVKAFEVEELLADFRIQSTKLDGLGSLFANLRYFLAPADDLAKAGDLVDFMETDFRLIDLDEASGVSIDYTVSSSSGTELQTYEYLQDYLLAVANNTQLDDSGSTLLGYEYDTAEDDGLFSGIYDSTGTQLTDTTDGIEQLLAGAAYLKIPKADTDAPDVYLDAEGFQNYVIALMLQDQEYIAADVYVEPIVFASTSQPSLAGELAAEWIEWHQLYFGKLTIAADADADTLTVDYNGAAGLAELGIDFAEYFEDAYLTYQVEYSETSDNNTVTVTEDPADKSTDTVPGDPTDITTTTTVTTETYDLDGQIPSPFDEEDFTALLMLTATSVYGDFADFVNVSESSFAFGGSIPVTADIVSYSSTDSQWSVMSENVLSIADYFEGVQLSALLEEVSTAIEGVAATGEVALLEVSTAVTEWSELHNSWDTIHKYTTDAAERAIAAMK